MVGTRKSTRSSAGKATSTSKAKSNRKKRSTKSQKGESHEDSLSEHESPSAPSPESNTDDSDAYQDDNTSDISAASLHSDALDDDSDYAKTPSKKRKRSSITASPRKSKKTGVTDKITKRARARGKKVEDESEAEVEVDEDGLEVVGTIVEAPKTGRVPPGQISQNTLNFLSQLKKPECNDRTWFKLHDPVYRLAEKEWKDFIDEFTQLLTEADPHIPPLPPNDVVHRIYRDVRFSNDKTPYKTGFSASFSRSGRKGIFAGFKPGGSMFAAGTWCPGKNELQTIRSHILRSATPLRALISAPAFVELFGKPAPHPKGLRQNVYGMEDELKVAPKGVGKGHTDIDLLKCRSFAVSCRFSDEEVLSPTFKEHVKQIVEVARPFVHGLNDMMTIPPDDEVEGNE